MSTMPATRPMPRRRKPAVPSNVLGMGIFILTELMFFAGLFSAFMIAEGLAVDGWPPAGQPRLPIEETALNSVALLASGVALFFAWRSFESQPGKSKKLMLAALLLGAFFVTFQGVEWVMLVREGLTLTTSTHGSFFYLMIGTHALHAVAAIVGLLWAYRRMARGVLEKSQLTTVQLFWFFVVGVWPFLYFQVYL